MSSLWRNSLVLCRLVLLVGCSAKPESSPSGSCSLSCTNARVSASDFKLTPLTPAAFTLACTTAGDPLTAPVTLRYKVTQPVTANYNSNRAAAPAAGGGNQIVPEKQVIPVTEVPVAAMGFEPVVYGNMAFSKTAGEFKNDNNEVNPVRYAGVVTPPSEWCSDSCGVITFEVWPNCVSGSVTAGVQAGALKSEDFVTITIAGP